MFKLLSSYLAIGFYFCKQMEYPRLYPYRHLFFSLLRLLRTDARFLAPNELWRTISTTFQECEKAG